MADATAPFIWGEGGQRLTPEQIERQRKVAEALIAKGTDYSPVAHWTQGLARVSSAVRGALEKRDLDAKESAGMVAQSGRNAAMFGGETDATVTPPAAPSMAGDGAARTMGMPNVSPEIKDGLAASADALGVAPVDLATAVSYETGGTFDPTKAGPTTKWGQHRGLIQFGEPQAKQHGVDWSNPVGSQLGPNGAVVSYLKNAGVKPGMGLLDIYSAINAGAPGLYNRSDAKAGGAPGTVRDKVERQMDGHRAKARALYGTTAQADMPAPDAMPVELETGLPGFAIPQGQTGAPMPIMQEGGALPNFDPATGRWLGPNTQAQVFAEQGAPQGGPAVMPQFVEQGAPQGGPGMPTPQAPSFLAEGTSQPWMGTAFASPGIKQVARALSATTPPARPADLALANPQADMPAPGAVQAMGQLQPQMPVQPDLSNTNDAGMRQLQVASEEQRLGLPSGANAISPINRIVQALMGNGTQSQPAGTTNARRVATALQGSEPAAPAPATSTGAAKVAAAVTSPPSAALPAPSVALSGPTTAQPANARLQAAYATLNSPYARPGERALAQGIIQQSLKGAEFETLTRPDGSVYRVPKTGGAPVPVFGPQSKPEGPTGDMREYDLHVAQEKAAGRRPESFTEWARGNKSAGRTAINIDTKGAGKFAEKANEHQAKRYSDMRTAADEGVALRGDIEVLTGLLDGVNTGRGAEAKLGIAQMAKGMGLDSVADWLTSGKINEMEAAQSVMDRLTPRMRVPGSGATSDMEMRTFRNSIPSLGKQPGGNRIIGDTFRSMLDHQAMAGDIAGKALRGEIDQAEADRMLKDLPSPFARFKDYQKSQDEAAKVAKGGTAAQPAPPEARKSIAGKSYVKRGAEWFEE